jgi:hypothetical protein
MSSATDKVYKAFITGAQLRLLMMIASADAKGATINQRGRLECRALANNEKQITNRDVRQSVKLLIGNKLVCEEWVGEERRLHVTQEGRAMARGK